MLDGSDSARDRLTDNSGAKVNKSQNSQEPNLNVNEIRTDSKSRDFEPSDSCKAVLLTFFLYGIGVLLPFNVLMSCLDYYADKVSVRLVNASCLLQ